MTSTKHFTILTLLLISCRAAEDVATTEPSDALSALEDAFIAGGLTAAATPRAPDDRDPERGNVTRDPVIRSADWDHEGPSTLPNRTDVAYQLDLFNPYRLARRWGHLDGRLSAGCNASMEQYLTALNQSESWAIKMWDASGRHSSGFFWGNGYWSGSKMMCSSLEDEYSEDAVPFGLGFNVVKMGIELPNKLFQQTRLHIGLCLPYICTAGDVRTLVELSVLDNDEYKDNIPRTSAVLDVQSPHNYYFFWKDSTFWVLVGVSFFFLLMVAIGTAYDLHLEHRNIPCFLQSNFTYEITQASGRTGDKAAKLNMGVQCLNNNVKECIGDEPQLDKSDNSNSSNNPIVRVWKHVSPGLLTRVILSFSAKLNLQAICDREVGSDTLPTIHGLRSISMVWVILGHTCIVAFKYSDNTKYRSVIEREFLFQTVSNATFSVDTFFFISGLLVSFLYFRTVVKVDVEKITKSTGAVSNLLQFLGLLAYRYFRLTVPYMFILGVVQICMKWFHQNSVFEPPTMDHENCPNYWWRNALYINTLFPVKDMCMLWSWYLADDTQFYVLGIVLLILASRHFRLAAITMVTFLASSWCTTAFIAYSNEHMPSVDDPLALFDKIYDKPWTRLGPYLIGMCIGWLLFKTDCKIKMNKLALATGWLLTTACMLCLVYGLYRVELHPLMAAAYSSLSHSAWALGLGWVVVACSTGHGGYITKILSLTILYPFSRVTYCAYLVHPLIIRIVPMMMDSPLHLTKETVLFLFLGQLVASYILAFIVSLVFEAPIVALLKILAPPKMEKTEDSCAR